MPRQLFANQRWPEVAASRARHSLPGELYDTSSLWVHNISAIALDRLFHIRVGVWCDDRHLTADHYCSPKDADPQFQDALSFRCATSVTWPFRFGHRRGGIKHRLSVRT